MSQFSMRVDRLRAAIEDAVQVTVTVRMTALGVTRLEFPRPPVDHFGWPAALDALRSADRWGQLRQMSGDLIYAEVGDDDD